VVLAGEAPLVSALLSTARWYGPSGTLFFFALGTMPLVGYAMSLRSWFWSWVTGLPLVALTFWTAIGFALVPAAARGGVEGTWLFFDFMLGIACAAAGLRHERRSAGSPIRT
jgi:hypothetical protein